MTTHLVRRLAGLAVRWYPRAWRERYAEEVLDVLDQHRVSLRTVADLMVNAAVTHLDPAYRRGRGLRSLRLTVGAMAAVAVLYGLWTLATREPTDFGVTGAHDVAFSADSRLVLTDGGDQALRLWDLADPAHPVELCRFRGGDSVSLSPDGRTVATVDDMVVLWDVSDTGRPGKLATLLAPTGEAQAAAFSADGRVLAIGYHDSVILFDVSDPAHPVQLTPLPTRPRPLPPQTFMAISFAPDGRTLATTSDDSDRMTLWDITDPAQPLGRSTLPVDQHYPRPKYEVMTFTPDSATLATNDDGLVKLWNILDVAQPSLISIVDTTATEGGRMGQPHNTLEVVITADGRTMVTVMNNVKASAWDISEPSRPVHLNDVIRASAGPGIYRISPDARSVVSADHPEHDTIAVWNIAPSLTPQTTDPREKAS